MPNKPVLITFDDGYADIAEFALPVLRRHRLAAVVFLVTDYTGKANLWSGRVGPGKLQLLTAKQIREWAGCGIEFGSHSRSHPDLTTLAPQKLRR
jgi:peptidoglycan/xylan/chitin deacetylase (PgdA/CDA1 family)